MSGLGLQSAFFCIAFSWSVCTIARSLGGSASFTSSAISWRGMIYESCDFWFILVHLGILHIQCIHSASSSSPHSIRSRLTSFLRRRRINPCISKELHYYTTFYPAGHVLLDPRHTRQAPNKLITTTKYSNYFNRDRTSAIHHLVSIPQKHVHRRTPEL